MNAEPIYIRNRDSSGVRVPNSDGVTHQSAHNEKASFSTKKCQGHDNDDTI